MPNFSAGQTNGVEGVCDNLLLVSINTVSFEEISLATALATLAFAAALAAAALAATLAAALAAALATALADFIATTTLNFADYAAFAFNTVLSLADNVTALTPDITRRRRR